MDFSPDKKIIEEAADRIAPFIHHTPVYTSEIVNKIIGGELFFKCENFQKAGAFKSRGATNALFSLNEDVLQHGVCTHSSGNHAAALSRAAGIRNVKAFIVMPDNSSKVKINAVKHYGGIIHFCSPTLASRESTLKELVDQTGAHEIHPYDDYRIIAGQATAAKELIEEVNTLNYIMTPVGGGGLLSGTALAATYFAPETHVIGAEPKGADDAYRSFNSGKFVPSKNPQTIADGLLTSLGQRTFPIILEHVHAIFTVSEERIKEAMRLIWERMKIIIEPSSAVPFAAVMENLQYFQNKRTGIILSGGNVDVTNLPWK